MKIRRLEHYNIRTTKFDETVRFYVDVLGMRNDVPTGMPATYPRSWIYDATGVPAVHLTRVDPADPEASYAKISQYRGGPDPAEVSLFRGSGSIDHVAFECEDFEDTQAKLRAANVPYVENSPKGMNIRQLFIRDPNGVTLELNFRG